MQGLIENILAVSLQLLITKHHHVLTSSAKSKNNVSSSPNSGGGAKWSSIYVPRGPHGVSRGIWLIRWH